MQIKFLRYHVIKKEKKQTPKKNPTKKLETFCIGGGGTHFLLEKKDD